VDILILLILDFTVIEIVNNGMILTDHH